MVTILSQVDIYSYGLLLFTVVSNGHKPHEDLTDPYEIDKAIEEVGFASICACSRLQPAELPQCRLIACTC